MGALWPPLPTPPTTRFLSSISGDPASHRSDLPFQTSKKPAVGSCSCSNRLLNTLYVLNGKVRRLHRDDGLEGFSREDTIQSILGEHTQIQRMDEEVQSCVFDCSSRRDNNMLIAMVIEQVSDLYSTWISHIKCVPHVVDKVRTFRSTLVGTRWKVKRREMPFSRSLSPSV
jgi:hypothetical protein